MRKFFRQTCIYIFNNPGSWESLNFTVTRLFVAQPKNWILIPNIVKRFFSFLWTVQNISGPHTASTGIHCILGVLLLGVVKWLVCEADHPPSSSAGIENRGLCLQCMHRDNFLSFTYHSWLPFCSYSILQQKKMMEVGWFEHRCGLQQKRKCAILFSYNLKKKMHLCGWELCPSGLLHTK